MPATISASIDKQAQSDLQDGLLRVDQTGTTDKHENSEKRGDRVGKLNKNGERRFKIV